jgi:hypothetical protein
MVASKAPGSDRDRSPYRRKTLVEILVINGCPHEEWAVELVAASAQRLGATPVVNLVEVCDLDQAAAVRFVGSPTIRVNGRDVAPAPVASGARAPALACRIYRTSQGHRGVPDERLVLEAMATAVAAELNV